MLYRSFLDDSKDKFQQKIMVSAGFFSDRGNWASLWTDWKRILRANGLEYFKSSEFYALSGQFSRFKSKSYPQPTGRQAAERIRNELKSVIESHPKIYGVAIAVILEDYKRVSGRGDAKGILPENPYHTAFNSIMFETVKLVTSIPGKNRVAFLHDDGPDIDSLVSSYKHFKKYNPLTAKSLAGFGGLDDKEHPPLQAADMIANYSMQRGLEALARNRDDLKAVISELTPNFVKYGYWDEDYLLLAIKSIRKDRGLSIPIDLQDTIYD